MGTDLSGSYMKIFPFFLNIYMYLYIQTHIHTPSISSLDLYAYINVCSFPHAIITHMHKIFHSICRNAHIHIYHLYRQHISIFLRKSHRYTHIHIFTEYLPLVFPSYFIAKQSSSWGPFRLISRLTSIRGPDLQICI